MSTTRTRAALAVAGLIVIAGAHVAGAESFVITSGQLSPISDDVSFGLYGLGEGIEWVPGEQTVWTAGVDLPPRVRMTGLIVYCLDNVEPNAMVQLFKVKGDGSAPKHIETVVTGGSRSEPGTGFIAADAFRTEDRVDRSNYHYFVRATLPPKPNDVRGILRITAIEVTYDR